MFSQNRELSVQIPLPHLVSIQQYLNKAVPTVPFQGACEIPWQFLSVMHRKHRIIVAAWAKHEQTSSLLNAREA